MKNCGKLRRSMLTGSTFGDLHSSVYCNDNFALHRKRKETGAKSSPELLGFPATGRIEHAGHEALLLDDVHDLTGMAAVTGLDHDFELRPFGRDVEEHAPVRHLEDVGPMLPEHGSDPAQDARPVVDLDT